MITEKLTESTDKRVDAVSEKVPSCMEIGLQAKASGNFKMARQMLRAAMEQIEETEDKQAQLIELTTNIADTYLNEGLYDSATTWYTKALQQSEIFYGKCAIQGAGLIVRLAEISVLQHDMSAYRKQFERVLRHYLLSEEASASTLLGALIDLSWVLSLQGQMDEVKLVNSLITQIKRIEQEDKLGIAVA